MRQISFLVIIMIFGLAICASAQQEPIRLMRYPCVSNGKIAFNYQGDLWLVEQTGGRAMRLTVHHGSEEGPIFSPDGKWIAFRGNYSGGTNVFIVPIDGGYPEKLPVGAGVSFSLSPDGRKMTFNRRHSRWWRKRYRGTLNQDVWVYDFEDKAFEQITTYDGNDSWPMWGRDKRIYFVSDRNGIANIFA